jgi:mRNA interferase MazF
VTCRFKGKPGQVVLDQLRTVEVQGLAKKLGTLDPASQAEVLRVLGEMFAP